MEKEIFWGLNARLLSKTPSLVVHNTVQIHILKNPPIMNGREQEGKKKKLNKNSLHDSFSCSQPFDVSDCRSQTPQTPNPIARLARGIKKRIECDVLKKDASGGL